MKTKHLVRRLNTAPIFWFHASQVCELGLSFNMINRERGEGNAVG
jgi:hypothetical protein